MKKNKHCLEKKPNELGNGKHCQCARLPIGTIFALKARNPDVSDQH